MHSPIAGTPGIWRPIEETDVAIAGDESDAASAIDVSRWDSNFEPRSGNIATAVRRLARTIADESLPRRRWRESESLSVASTIIVAFSGTVEGTVAARLRQSNEFGRRVDQMYSHHLMMCFPRTFSNYLISHFQGFM